MQLRVKKSVEMCVYVYYRLDLAWLGLFSVSKRVPVYKEKEEREQKQLLTRVVRDGRRLFPFFPRSEV